jgi:hypothetical protein
LKFNLRHYISAVKSLGDQLRAMEARLNGQLEGGDGRAGPPTMQREDTLSLKRAAAAAAGVGAGAAGAGAAAAAGVGAAVGVSSGGGVSGSGGGAGVSPGSTLKMEDVDRRLQSLEDKLDTLIAMQMAAAVKQSS